MCIYAKYCMSSSQNRILRQEIPYKHIPVLRIIVMSLKIVSCNIFRSSDGNPLGWSAQRPNDFAIQFPVFPTSPRMQVLLASSVTTHRVFFVLFNFFLPHRQLMQEGTISVSSIQCCLLRIQTSCLTSPEQKESLNESDKEIIIPALFSQLYLKG